MIVRIVEHDSQGALHLQCETQEGTIEVITDVRIEAGTAYLQQLHIDGPGAGTFGVQKLRLLAQEMSRQLGVTRLVIQGGRRTTGANPGRVPRPIVIRTREVQG